MHSKKHLFSFYFPEININSDDLFVTINSSNNLFNRILIVLRMKVEDQCILFNESGFFILVKLIKINKKNIIFQVLEKNKEKQEEKKIILYVPLLDFDYMKEVFFIAGQQGVSKIIFVLTEKSRKKLYSEKECQKLAIYLINGCEQGKQYFIPQWDGLNKIFFVDLLDPLYLPHCYTFFEFGKKNLDIIIKELCFPVSVFCGPEGGFSDKEIGFLIDAKNHSLVSLSKNILRSVDVINFATIFFSSL